MRIALDKFLEKLSVGHVLSPYETQPWVYYDEEKGITASAEVRMGPAGEDIEAEIQFLYDEIPDAAALAPLPLNEDGTAPSPSQHPYGGMMAHGRQQVLWMRAEPVQNEWGPKFLRIKGEDFVNAFHNWEEKGCAFFTACVQSIMMNELPDIDLLLDKHMQEDDAWGSGRSGRVGRKSPKIKPGALLGMKKPGGGM